MKSVMDNALAKVADASISTDSILGGPPSTTLTETRMLVLFNLRETFLSIYSF